MKVQIVLGIMFGIALNSTAQAQEGNAGYYFGECKNVYVSEGNTNDSEETDYSDEAEFKETFSANVASSVETNFSGPATGLPTHDEAELKLQAKQQKAPCPVANEGTSNNGETWEDFEWNGYRPGIYLKY